MSFFKTLFFRKKKAPLVCTMDLHGDPTHVHTDACFVEIKPLAIVEFFQSQGCEACPPAIPQIHKAAANNHNVLLLTYNVTYVRIPTPLNVPFEGQFANAQPYNSSTPAPAGLTPNPARPGTRGSRRMSSAGAAAACSRRN